MIAPPASGLSCGNSGEGDYFPFGDVVSPQPQCGAFLPCIGCSVVNASHAGLVATHMIEHRLDDVRLHAKFSHTGGRRAAQIVQSPVRYLAAAVESQLGFGPAVEALASATE